MVDTTLQAAKARTAISDGRIVVTSGYWTNGDDGHGIYRYDASNSDTANDGTIVALDTLPGRLLLQYEGALNVRLFGAKGDGDISDGSGTDDSAAIQAALDAVTSDGGAIFFPIGCFRISTTITVASRNIHLSGVGKRNAQGGLDITAAVSPSTILVDNGTSFIYFDANNVCNGFSVRDLTITGRSDGRADYAFDFDKAGASSFRRDFKFLNITIRKFNTAFMFRDSVGGGDKAWGVIAITRCSITQNTYISQTLDSTNINHLLFNQNEAGQNGYASGGGLHVLAHTASIEGNVLEGQRDPVKIVGAGFGINIRGNYFEGNTGRALIECDSCRNVSIGPNGNVGGHVDLEAPIIVRQLNQVEIRTDTVHPVYSFLQRDLAYGLLRKTGLNAESSEPIAFMCAPDRAIFQAPVSSDVYDSHDDSIAGSCPNPFSSQEYIIGYNQSNAALKTYTWPAASFSFGVDDWIVATFVFWRGEDEDEPPYFSFRVNDSDDEEKGSFAKAWTNIYLDLPSRINPNIVTLATRARVVSESVPLGLQIYPYDTDNAAENWSWAMSNISVYVTDDPNKITPRLNRSFVNSLSSAPTGGVWSRGSIIYNSAPSSAGKIGWSCVSAGSPGTWEAFGAID